MPDSLETLEGTDHLKDYGGGEEWYNTITLFRHDISISHMLREA